MRQAQTVNSSAYAEQRTAQAAASIPALGHSEAAEMGTAELEKFLTLIELLPPDDWKKPTACTAWDVREMVAHVAGAAASFARWSEMRRQNSARVQRPYRKAGLSKLDALNQIQVDDRAGVSPAELITELRDVGPRAVAVRRRVPAIVRAVRLPMGLVFPLRRIWVPIGYMLDVIYTRDMWMHRLDICRATGREMELTPGHDGRMTELVVRDLVGTLSPKLAGRAVMYDLTGPAGGTWSIGGGVPGATIRMDALDFHLLASGRMPLSEALSLATIDCDEELGNRALEHTWAVY